MENRIRADLAAIALLATIFILPGLFLTELTTTAEARYSQIAREMRLDGRVLTPRLNGDEYTEKPPLFFDLLQIPQMITGDVTPAGSRLVILPFAIIALWGTYGAGRILAGRRAALIAAACLGTNAQFVSYAYLAVFDVPLLACTTTAVFAYLLGTRASPAPRRWRLGVALAMGLGCLFKGPVAIVLPGAVIALDAVLRHRGRAFRSPAAYWIPAVALLALGVWLIPMAIIYGESFVSTMWEKQVVRRTVSGAGPHSHPFWYYVPNLIGGWLPWTVLIPAVAAATRRGGLAARPDPNEESPLRFPFLWAVAIPVILSLVASKRAQYLLPAAPGFALWIAIWIDGALRRGSFSDGVERWNMVTIRVVVIFLGAVAVSTAIAAPIVAGSDFGALLGKNVPSSVVAAIEEGFVTRLAILSAILFGLAGWMLHRATPARLLIAMLLLGTVFIPLRQWELNRFRDRFVRANEFGAEVRKFLDSGGRVGSYAMRLNGTYQLHSGATHFALLDDEVEIAAFLAEGEQRAVIGKRHRFEQYIWPHLAGQEIQILARHSEGRSEVVLFGVGDPTVPLEDSREQ